ncbi:hypothetical protein E5288_WYG006032 [Bos mutus]|uniref:Uncharacterized protein n=1 Tax=Bos mutus TaxID=72004 RepID=A0A6B0QUP9_9CETA|nr:hypothetical protein [Bos mutus]
MAWLQAPSNWGWSGAKCAGRQSTEQPQKLRGDVALFPGNQQQSASFISSFTMDSGALLANENGPSPADISGARLGVGAGAFPANGTCFSWISCNQESGPGSCFTYLFIFCHLLNRKWSSQWKPLLTLHFDEAFESHGSGFRGFVNPDDTLFPLSGAAVSERGVFSSQNSSSDNELPRTSQQEQRVWRNQLGSSINSERPLVPPGTSLSPLLQVGPGTKRIKINILEVVENLLRIVFNYYFEDFLMTRHPREGQEENGDLA